jgi:hypothetical protein
MKLYATLLLLCALLAGCASTSAPVDSVQGFSGALGLGSDQTIDEAVFYELNDLFEDSVQRCMKLNGFEYTPQPGAARTGRVGDDGSLSDEEYASEFGFGIWTALFDSGSRMMDASTQSINNSYLAEMSDEAQEAWRTQLKTCMQDGYDQQDNAGMLIAPFDEARIEIEQLVDVDTRVAEAESRWSSCMAAEGFVYGSFAAMFQSLLGEGQQLAGKAPGADQVVSVDATPAPYPEGVAFAVREIAAAEANVSCGEELRATRDAVRTELEQQRLGSDETLKQAAEEFRTITSES